MPSESRLTTSSTRPSSWPRAWPVDPSRIGYYGGSYGGFLTLMAMFTAGDTIRAGSSLRPVTDWAHYHAGYTIDILNLPKKDAEAYKRSSHGQGL